RHTGKALPSPNAIAGQAARTGAVDSAAGAGLATIAAIKPKENGSAVRDFVTHTCTLQIRGHAHGGCIGWANTARDKSRPPIITLHPSILEATEKENPWRIPRSWLGPT